jgi:hypothetical protein
MYEKINITIGIRAYYLFHYIVIVTCYNKLLFFGPDFSLLFSPIHFIKGPFFGDMLVSILAGESIFFNHIFDINFASFLATISNVQVQSFNKLFPYIHFERLKLLFFNLRSILLQKNQPNLILFLDILSFYVDKQQYYF